MKTSIGWNHTLCLVGLVRLRAAFDTHWALVFGDVILREIRPSRDSRVALLVMFQLPGGT